MAQSMMEKPPGSRFNMGSHLSAQLQTAEIMTAVRIGARFLAGGITMARNIPYNNIPMPSRIAPGNAAPATAPIHVPSAQPIYGITESPNRKGFVSLPGSLADTANISSVMKKAMPSRYGVLVAFSIFCDIAMDISAYRMLITSCVAAISSSEPMENITPTPASCPAEVRLVKDMMTACPMVSPPLTASSPNPIDTDRYPNPMGIPARSPFANAFMATSQRYHRQIQALPCRPVLSR